MSLQFLIQVRISFEANICNICLCSKLTGSGKTLIAVLLLRHMIDSELERRAQGEAHKISFFLVIILNIGSCKKMLTSA